MVSIKQLSMAGVAILVATPQAFALERRGKEKGLPAMPTLKEANAGARYVGPTKGKPQGHIVPAPAKARPVPKKAKTMRRSLELRGKEKGLPAMPTLKEANAGARYVGPTKGKPQGHIVPAPAKARPVPKKAKTMRRSLERRGGKEKGLPAMPTLKEANAGARYVGPTKGRPQGHIVPAPAKARPIPKKAKTMRRSLERRGGKEKGLPAMPTLKEANAGARYVGPTKGRPQGHIVPAPAKARPIPKKAKTMRRSLERRGGKEKGLPAMPTLKEANAGARYVGPTKGRPQGHIVPAPAKARPVPKKAKTI